MLGGVSTQAAEMKLTPLKAILLLAFLPLPLDERQLDGWRSSSHLGPVLTLGMAATGQSDGGGWVTDGATIPALDA